MPHLPSHGGLFPGRRAKYITADFYYSKEISGNYLAHFLTVVFKVLIFREAFQLRKFVKGVFGIICYNLAQAGAGATLPKKKQTLGRRSSQLDKAHAGR